MTCQLILSILISFFGEHLSPLMLLGCSVIYGEESLLKMTPKVVLESSYDLPWMD